MAEGGDDNGSNGSTGRDWVVPIAENLDLSKEKPYALRILHDLYGWVFRKNKKGFYDVHEEVIGPKKED